MKTIPLTVLVHDAPCARAYLSLMRQAGLRPERILHLVWGRCPIRKRAIAGWLPRFLRVPLAAQRQELANNYWPRQIQRTRKDLLDVMTGQLTALFPEPQKIIGEMISRFRYEDYSDNYERVLLDDFRSPSLLERLKKLPESSVMLYTGGGILPASLVTLGNLKWLHVHPGRLPAVRGADGLLWSVLVRGKPGFSCFYMDAGIDTGKIVVSRDFPMLEFPLPNGERPDDDMLYRAMFSFYDPLARGHLLVRDVLTDNDRYDDLPTQSQDANDGVTFHFFHSALRSRALHRVFPVAA